MTEQWPFWAALSGLAILVGLLALWLLSPREDDAGQPPERPRAQKAERRAEIDSAERTLEERLESCERTTRALEQRVNELTALANDSSKQWQTLGAWRKEIQQDVSTLREGLARVRQSDWERDWPSSADRGATQPSRTEPSLSHEYVSMANDRQRLQTAAPSREEQANNLIEEYCRGELTQAALLNRASRLQLAWGGVDINTTPPRFERERSGDVLAIRRPDAAEVFVVLGEDCAYSAGLSFFFQRVSAQLGQRVFASRHAEALLASDGTLERKIPGVLELRG